MSIEEKRVYINNFMNERYFPILEKYEVDEETFKIIVENIVSKLEDDEYVERIDINNYRELIDMATNGGIVYKAEDGQVYFKDINEAFKNSLLGTMAFLSIKNGLPMDYYELGNPYTLYDEAELKLNKYGREDFIMFFSGDSKGFYFRHREISDKSAIRHKPYLYNESKSKEILNNDKEILNNYKENIEININIEKIIFKDENAGQLIDPRTRFVKGSQEYNDYYYPQKKNKGKGLK